MQRRAASFLTSAALGLGSAALGLGSAVLGGTSFLGFGASRADAVGLGINSLPVAGMGA